MTSKTTPIKPGTGNNYAQFKKRLAGMSDERLLKMHYASDEIVLAFTGLWGDIPNVTLKEFIGMIEDERAARRRK